MSNVPVTTAEQLLTLREPGFRHELVRGELRRMTPAGQWHGAVAARLAARLAPFVEQHRLGLVFGAETGFVIAREPDTVLAPDAAFVARQRLGDVTADGFFVGAPDLAIEVRSPDDSRRALRAKAREWIEGGAREVWIVDPKARTLDVLRDDGEEVRLTVDDAIATEVVAGLCLRVADLFPELPGRPD